MANKLNYDEKSLLNIKFSPSQKGYDTLEVDQIFDCIISDYSTLNSKINELTTSLAKQESKNEQLKEDINLCPFAFVACQQTICWLIEIEEKEKRRAR